MKSHWTRREFLQTTAVVGVGLATAAMLIGSAQPAAAVIDNYCLLQYVLCIRSADSDTNPITRSIKKAGCEAQHLACIAAQILEGLNHALQQTAIWIANNAGAIIGTIVIIGVFIFIVIALDGQGFPILARV